MAGLSLPLAFPLGSGVTDVVTPASQLRHPVSERDEFIRMTVSFRLRTNQEEGTVSISVPNTGGVSG